MRIGFLSDFFEQHLLGGAELNDGVLINHLNRDHTVVNLVSGVTTVEDVSRVDFVIVSNFVNAKREVMEYVVNNKPYLLYEHDHKYVTNRDPSKFKDFKIPEEHIVNRGLYAKARRVICLSSSQTSIIRSNLGIDNLENISCSLWSTDRFKLLRKLSTTVKNDTFAIMDSANPIKNTALAVQMCTEKGIKHELIQSNDQVEFLTKLAGYEGLVFLPGVLESRSRWVTEAKMLGCKILTTPKKLGAAYEDWFHLSGLELIDVMENNVANALNLFEKVISE